MSWNFPTSLDNGTSLPNPTALDDRNSPSLAGGQGLQNGAVIAVETKLGTGASTPSGSNLLVSTGTGTSAWSKAAPTGTIVGTSDSQTLTNKILTSPTINTPTISSPTITGTTTIGTLTVSTALNAPAGSITPNNLVSGAGSTWPWQTWSPSWTTFTVGTSTVTASYSQVGKIVHFKLKVTLASGFAFDGTNSPAFSLPVTAVSSTDRPIAMTNILLSSPGVYVTGTTALASTTTAAIYIANSASAYKTVSLNLTTASNSSITTGSVMYVNGTYEAA